MNALKKDYPAPRWQLLALEETKVLTASPEPEDDPPTEIDVNP